MSVGAPLLSMQDMDAVRRFHDDNGFVSLADVLTPAEFTGLRAAVDAAMADGRLKVSDAELASNNDVVYLDPAFEALARHERIVAVARRLIGHPIELQHAKFNAKPPTASAVGEVAWHQDYPFYPHTNFDLVSCTIHFDDEDEDAGPVRFMPGSHRRGPLSHLDEDGRFAYEIRAPEALDAAKATPVIGLAGFVSFHHALTVHMSQPKRRPGHRRLIVLQYRATDAVQLAGVVWRCNGMQVEDGPALPRKARFTDGAVVDLRGVGGRLFDVSGKFAPDRPSA
jgi:ectoine hydroxylase-related dioxygenase (phytanoyl-CoA dioxygenase family)